jgi:hypothetical protein
MMCTTCKEREREEKRDRMEGIQKEGIIEELGAYGKKQKHTNTQQRETEIYKESVRQTNRQTNKHIDREETTR